MSQLKELSFNYHFTGTQDPEAYAAIFDTDEVHLLQYKVARVREIVGLALEETGAQIMNDGSDYPRTPGALTKKFHTTLPRPIYKRADEPFSSGVSHTDGKASGAIHMPMGKDSPKFEVRIINRPESNKVSRIYIPNSPDLFEIPHQPVPNEKVRFTILGIAAAAKFAARWNVASSTNTD